uniref:hypothetical protein n=1 Tax=Flavobacterium sp. TaxID=239 RepID=UPI004049EBE3
MRLLRKFIQYLLVPLLLTFVVFFQISKFDKGLSSWKGGGFGMYADYYPMSFDIRVNGEKILLDKKENLPLYNHGRKTLINPSEENIEICIELIKPTADTIHFEIWSPYFEGSTQQYSRKKRYEKTIIRNNQSK